MAVSGSRGLPFQSKACWGDWGGQSSHQTVSSSRLWATLVKNGPLVGGGQGVGIGLGVGPGATPKTLLRVHRPQAAVGAHRSQAMSSPTHQHFQPFF